MRRIGQLQEPTQVKRFYAYLRQQGIDTQVVEDPQGWSFWVGEENDVPIARESFAGFQADPEAERYLAAESDLEAQQAAAREPVLAEVAEPVTAQLSPPDQAIRRRFRRGLGYPLRRGYTLSFVFMSLFGAILIDFNVSSAAGRWMAFCDSPATMQGVNTLKNILSGEVWRLISPSFAYIDVRHLLFGTVFLYHFGVRIESLRGPLVLGLVILGAACFANLAQAIGPSDPAIPALAGGAEFAGMSGVVYGLFGFIWAQSIRWPNNPLRMDTLTIFVIIGWQVICIVSPEWGFGNLGHIAGLIFGVVAGAIYAPRSLGAGQAAQQASDVES